jgi:hypothetical protein
MHIPGELVGVAHKRFVDIVEDGDPERDPAIDLINFRSAKDRWGHGMVLLPTKEAEDYWKALLGNVALTEDKFEENKKKAEVPEFETTVGHDDLRQVQRMNSLRLLSFIRDLLQGCVHDAGDDRGLVRVRHYERSPFVRLPRGHLLRLPGQLPHREHECAEDAYKTTVSSPHHGRHQERNLPNL